MKNKTLVIVLAVCIVLGGGAIIYSQNRPVDIDPELADEWTDLIERANVAQRCGPESLLYESGYHRVETISEAEELLAEYDEYLRGILTDWIRENYLSTHETYPQQIETWEDDIQDPNYTYDVFVDAGCFDTEITDYTIDGDTADVTAVVTSWSKSISRGFPSQYTALILLSKKVNHVSMVKADGSWKINGVDSHGDIMMDSYSPSAQTFSTLEEAAAYATTVTPRNILESSSIR